MKNKEMSNDVKAAFEAREVIRGRYPSEEEPVKNHAEEFLGLFKRFVADLEESA